MKDTESLSWLEKIALAGSPATPYVLTDLSIVKEKVHQFKTLMPRVGIYFAIKSNNDPRVIRTLKDLVEGFDIASLGELEILEGHGISAARMLYSNPIKVPEHVAQTFKKGVRYFAIDSVGEIEKIKQHAPGSNVHIRVKVSDYGSKFPLSGKFGADPSHVVAYAAAAEEAGLKVKGLTFHVGSQAENTHVWEAAIQMNGKLISQLKEKGIGIEFLDIGGGFPANYEDLAPTIDEVAEIVNSALEKYIPSSVKIIAEPGRFISANASILATTVIGREHRSGLEWLYLDIGTFQGLIEPLEMPDWKYPILTRKHPKGYKRSFVLSGPTCDACDTIGLDYLLPSDINVGDRIYLAATGAYTTVYGSNFNGFQIPRSYYVKKGSSND